MRHFKVSRVLALLVVVVLALSAVIPAAAQGNATIVNASRVNLRSGPGAGYGIVTVLTTGQQIGLLSTNADRSWYQVQTADGRVGWVAAQFIGANYPDIQVGVSVPTGGTSAVVTSPFLNVRSGPGANFDDVGTLARGLGVDLVGRNADSSWAQVNVPGGVQGGWVSTAFISASIPIRNLPVVSNTGVSPAFPPAAELGGQTGLVTAPSLNVRLGPGAGFGAFARLRVGTGVSLVGRNGTGSWLLVLLADGRSGWVSTSFIRTDFPIYYLEVRA